MIKLFVGALGAVCLTTAATANTARVPEDEAVEYRFRAALDNGRGVTSLADLRGKPVLIDFWGTR